MRARSRACVRVSLFYKARLRLRIGRGHLVGESTSSRVCTLKIDVRPILNRRRRA